ncbi:hypothetical protein [Nonomuraea wenchangensis]|uniref:Uncharacterized protein n=1 Tax=Nonomuraea wenchangensis TaxID=568860 RepID=A0A1I0EQN6_9ACTN|nr:hypothetical protein [Nonomuraea wenchangensis]SET47767.1 hypothetical protein SAMN05421811_103163 [Nonomuraea wenchangensis]
MRISKSATLLSAVFLAAAVSVAGAVPASADISSLDITAIGYNAYGADTAANRNDEFVEVTARADVNVKDLLVQDAWAKGRDKTFGCNTYRLRAGVLPVAPEATADVLPNGAVLRIHMGAGAASVDRAGVRHVYANMRTACGYNGHIFNNGPSGSNKWAAWDIAWVTLGTESKSRAYNFSFGYVAR